MTVNLQCFSVEFCEEWVRLCYLPGRECYTVKESDVLHSDKKCTYLVSE